MRFLVLLALVLLGGSHGPQAIAGTYELLFQSTALKGVASGASALVYDRVVSGSSEGQADERFSLDLVIKPDDLAALTLHQGDRFRGLGEYPASVGNPVIMYFLESVLADISLQSGGSPFYMRNRIKEALLREADAEITPVSRHYQNRDISARQVTIRPFVQDKARARMGRFAELALAVTVSEDIPGWYYSLVATVPAAGSAAGSASTGGAGGAYSNAITLKSAGEGQP